MTIQQAYDTSHEVATNGNISDIEGLLNVYATQIATLSSQLDYNPRGHTGITFANASVSVQPPWSSKGSEIYLGKALQGSFVQFGFNYANRNSTVFPGDEEKFRGVRIGTRIH